MKTPPVAAAVLLASCICLLASCIRPQAASGKKSFLKDRAERLERLVEWSDDVGATDSAVEGRPVASALIQNPLAHMASFSLDGMQKNCPFLPGFASLDTSSYSDASRAALEGFCQALEQGAGEDAFMDKGHLYSLVLFKYRLPAGRGIRSHTIGRPLLPQGEGDSLQCPVRLLLADGSERDVYVYLVKSASDWKVQQIDDMAGGGSHEQR